MQRVSVEGGAVLADREKELRRKIPSVREFIQVGWVLRRQRRVFFVSNFFFD